MPAIKAGHGCDTSASESKLRRLRGSLAIRPQPGFHTGPEPSCSGPVRRDALNPRAGLTAESSGPCGRRPAGTMFSDGV